MKILIAGGGKIGSTIASQLAFEGHDITMIDMSYDVLNRLVESYDVSGIQGNAASMKTLFEAGVKDANLLIAATDKDEINLLACMCAHGMNHNIHTIGRIRNPEYRMQAYAMQDVFGLNMVINPEQQAAKEIAGLLKFPGFLTIDRFAKGMCEIVELKVDAKSPLNGVSLRRLESIVHCNVLVCAVLRNNECVIPYGDFELMENDRIYVTANTNNLNTLLVNLNIITRKNKRALIAGGSRISYYLCQELSKSGIQCTIVEKDEKRCEELACLLEETTIIHGDASNQAFLEQERLDQRDALVSLTDLDELNIIIGLYANAMNINQIVTKLSHTLDSSVVQSLPIGSIVSPKDLVCANIVRYVRAMNEKQGGALTIHKIANNLAEAIEFRVDASCKYVDVELKHMKMKDNVLVVGIGHKDHFEIPNGDSKFALGDSVLIVTDVKTRILSLNDIFKG